jgi:hypothetical protein
LTIPESVAIKIMIDAGVKPLVPYKKAKLKWKSRCVKCERVVYPRLADVKNGVKPCAFCSNRKADLKEVNALMRKHNLEPLEPYKSALSRWKCKCLKCGNIVYPKYNNVQQESGGCSFCAKKGIDMSRPSYVYLITNSMLGAHKIGIGNVQEKIHIDRLKGNRGFIKAGWKVHKIWYTESGALATRIETEVFRILRKELKLPQFLSKESMPKTRGESETVSADSITLIQVEKIINKVIKGLQK